MKMLRTGHRMKPCGTPLVRGHQWVCYPIHYNPLRPPLTCTNNTQHSQRWLEDSLCLLKHNDQLATDFSQRKAEWPEVLFSLCLCLNWPLGIYLTCSFELSVPQDSLIKTVLSQFKRPLQSSAVKPHKVNICLSQPPWLSCLVGSLFLIKKKDFSLNAFQPIREILHWETCSRPDVLRSEQKAQSEPLALLF